MTPFTKIYNQALENWGEDEVNYRLSKPKTAQALKKISNSEYLSTMSRRIFRAGLKHSMVDAKWPNFEEVFYRFDIDAVRMMSDEAMEKLMQDTRIIRHWGKLKSVRANAQSMSDLLNEYEGFGHYLADWPSTRVVELWHELQKRFTQLGGNSAPYFLRLVGKDTFVLTNDVKHSLNRWGAFNGEPKGKKAQLQVQECFNVWVEESSMPFCQVSMLLALSAK